MSKSIYYIKFDFDKSDMRFLDFSSVLALFLVDLTVVQLLDSFDAGLALISFLTASPIKKPIPLRLTSLEVTLL